MRGGEIPYGRVEPRPVRSRVYEDYRRVVEQRAPRRLHIYDRYFWATARVLDDIARRGIPMVALFVGRATLGGVEIPVDEVLAEHLESHGYSCRCRLVDRIRSRKLFRGRNNANPGGMTQEVLVVLELE